ncbi:unnamed protein product [Xylocopa violacea]|uniref:FAM194 C-terminal domain-containing protein n=1 Tax=Xylocopa violacea TaxID=135666 RepID=A0ABP1NTU1_XYLVO
MYTVFSPGGKDRMGVERRSQILAVFDTVGNGAVFNENGATRLSYNQIGGISRDNPTGVPFMWKWNVREKKPVTKIVYVEKPAEHLEKLLCPSTKTILKNSGSPEALTSQASSRHKEKKVEEQKPVIREYQEEEEEVESGYVEGKSRVIVNDIYPNYPQDKLHFKTICLSVNHYISLRILNRSNINLRFFAEKKTIKIELGTFLNLNKKVETYYVDSSLKEDVLKCRFERLLSSRFKMDSSMYDLIKEFRKVKKSARQRKLMMDKYRPYLRDWLKSGTRCRPR